MVVGLEVFVEMLIFVNFRFFVGYLSLLKEGDSVVVVLGNFIVDL